MQEINENVVMIVQLISTLSFFSVPFGLIAKALLIVSGYRTSLGTQAHKVPFLQGYISCILLASAGTNTVALLRGESIGILRNNAFWLTFGIIYGLAFYTKIASSLIQTAISLPFFKAIFLGLSCMDRGNIMIRYGVDGVTDTLRSDKFITKLVCGTLVGCASDLWSEMFSLRQLQWSFSTPCMFFKFGTETQISFFTIIIYFLLSLIDTKIAHAWSVLFFSLGHVSIYISNTFSKKTKDE